MEVKFALHANIDGKPPIRGTNIAWEARSESNGAGDWRMPGAAPAPRGGRPRAREQKLIVFAAED